MHHAPQSIHPFVADQLDRLPPAGATFLRVGVRTRTDEQQSAHPLGRPSRQCEGAITAHRRSDDCEVAVCLAGDGIGPLVHRLPAAVQPRCNHLVPRQRRTLRLPHLFVERERVQ